MNFMSYSNKILKIAYFCMLFSTLLLSGLSACSKHGAPIEENEALRQVNFNEPIQVGVSLNQALDNNGVIANTEDAYLIALFTKSGDLHVTSNTNGNPWWIFQAPTSFLNVSAGTRKIISHSDERYWDEGSVKYYAETINYEIQLTDKFRALLNSQPLKASLRLVITNDPAIGTWQIYSAGDRGTHWSQDDQSVASSIFHQIGARYLGDFYKEIAETRSHSYDLIEQDLANRGVLGKFSGQNNVLASSQNKTLFFVGKVFPLSQSITVDFLENYCANLNVGKYHWHLPTDGELMQIMHPVSNDGTYSLIDTPDNRLWQMSLQPSMLDSAQTNAINGQITAIVSSTRYSNSLYLASYAAYWHTTYNNGSGFSNTFHKDNIDLIRNELANNTIGLTDHSGNAARILTICSAHM